VTTHAAKTAHRSRTEVISPLTRAALERICVAQPYFAFRDLEYGDDGESITAGVPPSPPPAPEVGAAEAAQVARHLAILGSCAAALGNPSDARHHYLAAQATYARTGGADAAPIDVPMRATARAEWQDKRTVTATMTLAGPSGEPLNRLDVTYAVMKPSMFRRLNPLEDVSADERTVPAGAGPIVVERSRGTVTADYGPVAVELCAGHFPDHPVAPIALVMGRLVLTARNALCSQLGADIAYRVESGTVEATGLAKPGQRLVLEAGYEGERPDGTHMLNGRALADDVEVGAVRVNLSALRRPAGRDVAH